MWSYDGRTGPDFWEDLDPEWAENAGDRQSPIDLPSGGPRGFATLDLSYEKAEAGAMIDRLALRIDVGGDQSVRYNGVEHTLDHIHFHTPSEHTVDGESAAFEAHLVHIDPYGRFLVLGVLGGSGAHHEGMAALLDRPSRFDPGLLLPRHVGAFWTYKGSLTTPPLSEGVTWVVFEDRIEASADQVERLMAVCGRNRRPVQPMNQRRVNFVEQPFRPAGEG